MGHQPYWASLAILLALLLGASANGATPEQGNNTLHRVVVDVSTNSNKQWSDALNNVENLRKAFAPKRVEIEVVAYGKGLGMLVAAGSEQKDRIKTLADEGVRFRACENSMRKRNVAKADLLPQVETVDSGVAELVRKQEAGWSYLKSGP